MDGLHSLAASDDTVTIGGAEYRLPPLRLVDLAAVERHLLDTRPDPLTAVLALLASLDEPLQRHLLELAYDDAHRGPQVAHHELFDWLETASGQIYRLWLAQRRAAPYTTLAEVEKLLEEATPEEETELRRALERASGDPRGN